MREIVNVAKAKVGGILVVLTGSDKDYKYVMTSERVDLGSIYKDANSKLLGRGGGRDNMIQGSFSVDLEAIEAYFKDL